MLKSRIEREIWFEFSHSTGAGGQHVNKAATRAVICFVVDSSSVFSAAEKVLIKTRLRNRISADGILRLAVEDSRSQAYNRNLALTRLSDILSEAIVRPKKRVNTSPTHGAKKRRLKNKRIRSELKVARRKVQL